MDDIMDGNERVFIDTDGNQYYTSDTPLAEGGQGMVFLSRDKEIVVKISLEDLLPYEEYEKQLDENSGIFIHPNAGIARPIIKLEKPEKGYVMRFLDGGKAIGLLMKYKADDIDGILKEYNDHGGLKRRLLLLKDLAKTLWYVHRSGAVYGDISDKNVFISQMRSTIDLSADNAKIRLIDADNIRIGQLDGALYTPGYGAPEVVKGKPNTAESDMYSFALLAYTLLNINNPFDGNAASEECWDAEPVSMDDGESAEEGGKAFIYDRNDNSNYAGEGMLPWQFGLTEKLLGLFERAFSYRSRKSFIDRPAAAEWYNALSEAAEDLYYCRECDAHHYPGSTPHQGDYKGLYAFVDDLSPTDDGYQVTNRRRVVCEGVTPIIDAKIRAATLEDSTVVTLTPEAKGLVTIGLSSGYTVEMFESGHFTEKSTVSVKGTILVTNEQNPDEYATRITFKEEP